jgi:hypothetical protein
MTPQEFDQNRTKYAQKVLGALTHIVHKYPHLRIGQIIRNAIENKDLFYLENDKMFDMLYDFELKLDQKIPPWTKNT